MDCDTVGCYIACASLLSGRRYKREELSLVQNRPLSTRAIPLRVPSSSSTASQESQHVSYVSYVSVLSLFGILSVGQIFWYNKNKERNPPNTSLYVNQSPGNFVIFWNVIVPLSVLPSMFHYGLRWHEVLLLMALMLNPYIMEYISQNHFLAWVVVMFLVNVIYNVSKRWPWYNIYSKRFLFKVFFLVLFLAIPDIIISYIWPSLCKGLYNIIRNADKSLKPAQIIGYENSVLLIGAAVVLLHSMYFCRTYLACSCKFWSESPQNRCPKPGPDRSQVSKCPISWKWFRNGLLKTITGCR